MNKRIMALILGAALTTGMGGYGTYAYFTDHQEVKDNVEIVFGKLDVEADWNKDGIYEWASISDVSESKIGEKDITNVKPGDKFTREIKVKNTGTLKGDLEINLNESFHEAFDVKMKVYGDTATSSKYYNKYREKAVEPGEERVLAIEITAKPGIGNDLQGNKIRKEAHEFIDVDLTQVTK